MGYIDIGSIKTALKNDELIFFYQPKVSFITGKIVGAEALLRWRKKDGTIIPPGEFIPLAESTGFITEITLSMFPKLLADMQILRHMTDSFHLSFNVSAIDLKTARLLSSLRHAISTGQIGREEIKLEITEGAVINEEESVNKTLRGLFALGVKTSMDDFGTGYSSLDILSRLPFNELKIDQGLLKRYSVSGRNDIILTANIAMASLMGIHIVVEGVETEHMYYSMQQSGSHECQGYYISPPVPLNDFVELARSEPQWYASTEGIFKMAFFAHSWFMKLFYDWLFVPDKKTDQSLIQAERLRNSYSKCLISKSDGGIRDYYNSKILIPMWKIHEEIHDLCNLILDSVIEDKDRVDIKDLLIRITELDCKLTKSFKKILNDAVASNMLKYDELEIFHFKE